MSGNVDNTKILDECMNLREKEIIYILILDCKHIVKVPELKMGATSPDYSPSYHIAGGQFVCNGYPYFFTSC